MPDYDPKSIPTLDDVIESVTHEDNKAESLVVEDEPVLFTAEPVVDLTDKSDFDVTELEPEISFDLAEEDEKTEPDLNDTPPELTDKKEPENFESALIDYDTEEPIPSEPIPSNEKAPLIEETGTDEQSVTTQAPTTISATDLQSISDEIVLQLMPELEQRLRVLVQQVLEEKLPSEIIQFDAASNTDADD